MKESLVEKAKKVKGQRTKPLLIEEIPLAVAYVQGEITMYQAAEVMGISKNQGHNCAYRMLRLLKEGVRIGMVELVVEEEK